MSRRERERETSIKFVEKENICTHSIDHNW